MKNGTIAHWIDALNKEGFSDVANSFYSDKNIDRKRLEESGLPLPDFLKLHLKEFNQNNNNLLEFFSKYNDFVICLIPNTSDLERKFKIGVKSFEECLEFLKNEVNFDDDYLIHLKEKKDEAYVGCIISNGSKAIVELSDEGELDEFSHGELNVIGGLFDNGFKSDFSEKEIMLKALNFLKDGSGFKKGYFEFVVFKPNNEVIFTDYNVNEVYYKDLEKI